jgi:hypothetical protein
MTRTVCASMGVGMGTGSGPPSPSMMPGRPHTPLSASHSHTHSHTHSHSGENFLVSRSNSRDSGFGFARSNCKEMPPSLLNPGTVRKSPSVDKLLLTHSLAHGGNSSSSSSNDSSDGELRSFSPAPDYSSHEEGLQETRALTLLEFKKRIVQEKKNKQNKSKVGLSLLLCLVTNSYICSLYVYVYGYGYVCVCVCVCVEYLTRRESEPIPVSPQRNSSVSRRKKKVYPTIPI